LHVFYQIELISTYEVYHKLGKFDTYHPRKKNVFYMLDGQPHVGPNNKDVSSLKYLLGVWFMIHTYAENLVRSRKITLCVSHILR
jgi:hypothetical protein